MKKLIAVSAIFGLAVSVRALPVYDNFSTYGAAGTWAEVPGPPIVSYYTGAPLVGGNTAPSGESWIMYTNAPVSDLYSAYYAGDFTGYADQNVAVVNYFASGQPGQADAMDASLPAGFPGPFVFGHDTSAYSVWTPGWSQTGEVNPALQNYLGGVGACLKFASSVSGTGNKVFASFFIDVPDCTGSFGSGQSLDHGYTAAFINSAELPSPSSTANQNVLPGYAGYTPAPMLFAKLNMREVSASTWRPGAGYLDSNANSDNATAADLTQKTIHFIVMSYEFLGGAGADAIRVWVDPANTTFAAVAEPSAGATSTPTTGDNLPDVGGFFFLANTQDGGATPNSGVIFNSLSVGTNWAYVTGGPQFTGYGPNITAGVGQTIVLNTTALAGGGVACTYAWQTNNGVNSGPLITGAVPGGHTTSVGPTGSLTIANVQASDAVIYTLQVSTAITTENSVTLSTSPQTLVAVMT